MAGYSGTPLTRKLGIKPGHRLVLRNEPRGFRGCLRDLPENVTISTRAGEAGDLFVWFVQSSKELSAGFASIAMELSPTGLIWVAWPKKSSGIKSDLSFDVVQKTGLGAGLVDTKICAIDETWSGLKFVVRLTDRKR